MPQKTSNRYALLVGISHSPETGGKVQVNGDNTVRLMASILKDDGWSRKNMMILTNRQVKKQKVLEGISWLKEMDNEDATILFMNVTHGSACSVRWWDFRPSHRMLKEYLSGFQSKRQLVIIATCQSGGAVEPGFDGITLGEPNRIVVASCGEPGVDPCTHRYTRWAERFLIEGLREWRMSIQQAYQEYGGRMLDNYGQPFYLGD